MRGPADRNVISPLSRDEFAMDGVRVMLGAFNDVLSMIHGVGGTVDDEHELVGFQRYVVLDDAVLGNTDTEETRTDGADSTHYSRTFKSGNNPGNQRASNEDGTYSGNREHSSPKQQSPESSPERSELSPAFHPIPSVVVAHNVLIGMSIFAGDRQNIIA